MKARVFPNEGSPSAAADGVAAGVLSKGLLALNNGLIDGQPAPDDKFSWSNPRMRLFGIAAALLMVDAVTICVSIALGGGAAWLLSTKLLDAPYLAFGGPELHDRLFLWFYMVVGLCAWFAATGAYTTRRSMAEDSKQVVTVLALTLLIDGCIEFALRQHFSRLWIVLAWPLAAILIPPFRVGIRRVLDYFGCWRIGAAVFGRGERYGAIVEDIEKDLYVGYFVAYHADFPGAGDPPLSLLTKDIARGMALRGAEMAVLVPDPQEISRLDRVIDALNLSLTPYCLVPPVQRLPFARLTVRTTSKLDAILMSSRPGLLSPAHRITKRAFDIIVSAGLLVFLLPAFIVIGLCVAASGFPIFYGHERVGRGRKRFRCLKFRTMVVNSEQVLAELLARDPDVAREWRQNFKLTNDPRITPIGRFLRKTSLDELPQLFNVLRGEMSLVGPRPVVAKEIALYYGEDALYYDLVRPGVTGLWQVNGRSQTSYTRRVHLDGSYVRNWSLWKDMMILFNTVPSVLAGDGAQ